MSDRAQREQFARTPLITPDGWRLLRRLQEHPDAPRFTYAAGDRLIAEDLSCIERFREALRFARFARGPGPPSATVVGRVGALRDRVPLLRERLPVGIDLAADWERIPTSSREDLALRPWAFVPDDEPLERLVLYRTAGTTGHPVSVPHHPLAIGCYAALVEFALERHGVGVEPLPGRVACFLVSHQVRTYTYATSLAAWRGAGFAKINLRDSEWPRPPSPQRYLDAFAPPLLTGDALAFALMRQRGIRARPAALVITSVQAGPAVRQGLAAHFGAPVVDWYSLVETGPIAYSCPAGDGHHLLPHDIHLEAVRPDGTAAGPGERGELTVTGGRNPFAPLVRYRTGDWGRLAFGPCPCGDPQPRILDLEGRAPVLFLARDGTPVSTVDLSRALRQFPLLQHRFVQRRDRTCELALRGLPGEEAPVAAVVAAEIQALLGGLPLAVRFDPRLGDDGGGKVVPYESELEVMP